MKKILALVLALSMMLGMTSFALAEDITLEFWVRNSDDFVNEIAAYEAANPGVKINQVQVGANYDDLVAKYNAAQVAGNLPQVALVGQRHGIPQWYDAGVLLPAQEWLTEEEQADVLDNFWTRYTYNGVRLAVPFGSSMPMLWYNKTMLDELGLAVPETITEMMEAAIKAVKDVDGDGATDIYGVNFNSDTPWYIQPMVWSMGGTIIDEEGNVTVDIPEAQKVFEMLAEMVRTGALPANQHGTANADFCNGNSLFYITSCASKEGLQNNIGDKFELGVAFFPGEVTRNVCIGGNGLAIFKSTPEMEEASAKFVKYMISVEGMNFNLTKGYMPFTNSQFASELIQQRLEDPMWKIVLDQVQYIRGQNIHPADSTIWSEMMNLISAVEADPDMDIAAALKDIQAEVDEFMMLY